MGEISRQPFWEGWRKRLAALRNIPPVMRIVWASGPQVIVAGLSVRLLAALIPVAMLSVSRLIIDAIVSSRSTGHSLARFFWWLVALEFSLAVLASILGRVVGFFDSLFADRFTRHIGVRVMDTSTRTSMIASEENRIMGGEMG